MRLALTFALVPFLFLTGCNGLAKLAEGMLYANTRVNKDYPVPEVPPEGIEELSFKFKGEDGGDVDVRAWYVEQNAPNAPTVVYFHGNGENLATLLISQMLEAVASLGVNVLAVDYPDYGRSTGAKNEYNLVTGAVKAIQWAKQNTGGKVYVWGRSMGAAVALLATVKTQQLVSGLVLTSPWSSFYELAVSHTALAKRIPKDWLEKNAYDSVKAAPKLTVPTLIHHGLKDTVIPIKFGRKLLASFHKDLPCVMRELPDLGHNDIFQDENLWLDVAAFFRR